MDKFRIGMRVMVIPVMQRIDGFSVQDGRRFIGAIGTIVARGEVVLGYQRWELDIDPACQPIEPCLEPIYDGDQPASWEDCAWKPEKVKA